MPFVYVIKSEILPGFVKIGATRDVEARVATLQSTLPGKIELVWSFEVEDMFLIESKVRRKLRHLKIKNSNDWFNCPKSVAVKAFQSVLNSFDDESENETGKIEDDLKVIEDLAEKAKFELKGCKVRQLKDLGDYCKEIRKKFEFTQRELAEYCNVGTRFICELEAGKKTCQFDLCLKVAECLGVDFYCLKRS